jgi:pantoate--beta-alanine ligase
MEIIRIPHEIQQLSLGYRQEAQRIGLVPTMGWFHEGHLSLMRKARGLCDRLIVSLFINPMQFGPTEDLDNYPYDLKRDCALARDAGVDVLFAPDKESIYPSDFASTVAVSGLSSGLCAASRPTHFDGVTTVVAKLFNLTLPHMAVFGEKDFQQLAIIRKMVSDLDFPIEVISHPIVREKNGLAMSSRNTYLKEDEMEAALSLSAAIDLAKSHIKRGDCKSCSVQEIHDLVYERITKHPECQVDYIEIVNRHTLGEEAVLSPDSQIVVAVKINNRIRLIDNSILKGS